MDVGGQALISKRWSWSVPLVRFIARQARINIVDQKSFKLLFESWGAKTLLLERPPYVKDWNRGCYITEKARFKVTLISSFFSDEPVDLVLEAAEVLSEMTFYILGDTALAKRKLLSEAPDNVKFTGYLAGDEYWDLLDASQAVMVLTTAQNSLSSGAVEGMCIGKPLILSKQPALTEYFTKGAIFIDHSVEGIIHGLQLVRMQESNLVKQIMELAINKRERWEKEFKKVWSSIGEES
jgi:glycosyltransferase involved in cell wall biosynthesis